MAYLTDKQLQQVVLDYLDGKTPAGHQAMVGEASCGCCWVGMQFDRDFIYTIPGAYALLNRYNPNSVWLLGLDWLFDISDEHMESFRTVIISALEKRNIPFVPISWNALYRLDERDRINLVDRVGRECVFTIGERYYISGYDKNEDPPLYFLARLPHAVQTYDEAIEALKPPSVKRAEECGAKVLRQGDMFAIPTSYVTLSLRRMGATFFRDWNGLYGTSHFATETARLADGTMLGRGRLLHRPPGRNPDHRDLNLVPDDGSWFLIVKNTVPIVPISEGR
jgi:hypothetical protein